MDRTHRLFELTGGDLALDFANTLMARRTAEPEEWLPDYAALVRWAVQSGVVDAAQARALTRESRRDPAAAARALRRAIAIRELLFGIFLDGPDAAALDELDALALEAAKRRRLTRRGTSFEWAWQNDGLDTMLWPVVHAAAALLTSETRARIRVCEGLTCLWLFVDNSRQQNRRWCDMTTCGNRAKARRHYRKSKGR